MADFPVASHTFDFTRIYLSTRDLAAPGSGAWSNPVTIFDGSGDSSVGGTFSAGALGPTDPKNGIIVQDGHNRLVYLGNGIPDTPRIITVTGDGNIRSNDYWDLSQGAFETSSGSYIVFTRPSNGRLAIAKSTDGWVTAGTIQDPTNGPTGVNADGSLAAIQRIDSKICVFTPIDQTDDNYAVWEFNLDSNLWGPQTATLLTAPIQNWGLNAWSNGLFKFPNGDYLIFYVSSSGVNSPVVKLWSALSGTWGSELSLSVMNGSCANCVMDPDLNTVHLFSYAGLSRGSAVHYGIYNHLANVVTANISTFGSGIASTDGVGHCSIQGGMLFVPRDATVDQDNAVWVGTLPTPATFFQEDLPIPAGETGVIDRIALNGNGTGYVNGDTFTVNGGIVPLATGVVNHVFNNAIASSSSNSGIAGTGYAVGDHGTIGVGIARYQITGVGVGGAVTGYVLTTLGSGYSVASNVATTATDGVGTGFKINILSLFNGVSDVTITSRGQGYSVNAGVATTATSGVGVGLTINIFSVTGKTPSCAYMMYPNGYNLNPAPITLDFDLIGSPSGTGLARVNPDSPAPGPILTPTECINQQ